RQWIDATETGELVRLALPTATPRKPDRLAIHLHLQHPDWDSVAGAPAMGRTRWATERLLTHTWAADALPGAPWRQRIVPVLDQLRDDLGSQALGQTTLSHLSIEPMPLYDQP